MPRVRPRVRAACVLVSLYGEKILGTGAESTESTPGGNRARFINLLGTEWLPAIVDVHERLRAEPPARVLDVACGTGWASTDYWRFYRLLR